MAHTLVNTTSSIQNLLQTIQTGPIQPPLLFIDIEGVNLSRDGAISIIQILIPPFRSVFIVDVHTLQHLTFSTANPQSSDGATFRSALESNNIVKLFFDVRRDSDALFGQFGIRLQGVVDIQLLEFATRPRKGGFLGGLEKCISLDLGLSVSALTECRRIKEVGVQMFSPEKGGSYAVWLQRPLPKALLDYSVQDVMMLPNMLLVYAKRLNQAVAAQVHTETLKRVTQSQGPTPFMNGRHMAIGPTFSGR